MCVLFSFISSEEDEFNVSKRPTVPSPISATSLAACMKVDSLFCSNFVPTHSIAATLNSTQLTVYNHLNYGEILFIFYRMLLLIYFAVA